MTVKEMNKIVEEELAKQPPPDWKKIIFLDGRTAFDHLNEGIERIIEKYYEINK